jgi:translation initiation factor 2B subunit (eIF-2B alpha/beta/delta family)
MTAEQDLRGRIESGLAEIRADHEHGAGYLAQRGCDLALAVCDACNSGVVRLDAAITLLHEICRELAQARMSMAPLVSVATLIDRAVEQAGVLQSLGQAEAAAREIQDTWRRAPGEIAARLRDQLPAHAHIVTISRSAVVEQALTQNADLIAAVTVLESRPGGEGVDVARRLAASGHSWSIRLVPDAAVALAMHGATSCLSGADALLATGYAVNKTGTNPLALAAHAAGIPCYVLAETLKIAPANWEWRAETFSPELVAPTPIPGVAVEATAFERVPLDLVTVLTEGGLLDATAIAARARDLNAGYERLLAGGSAGK